MSLEELRRKIDKTDAEIVKLIGERMRIAQEIGKQKRVQGLEINDQAREKKVSQHIKHIAQGENINQEIIENVYKQII